MKKSIQLPGSKLTVNSDDVYLLTQGSDSIMLNYIAELSQLNTSKVRTNVPFLCYIGSKKHSVDDIWPALNYLYEPKTQEVIGLVHQKLLHSNPSYIVIGGLNNMDFDMKTPKSLFKDLERFLLELFHLQVAFKVPILLTTEVKLERAGLHQAIPKVRHEMGAEIEIVSERVYGVRHERHKINHAVYKLPKNSRKPLAVYDHPETEPRTYDEADYGSALDRLAQLNGTEHVEVPLTSNLHGI